MESRMSRRDKNWGFNMFPRTAQMIFLGKGRVLKTLKFFSYPEESDQDPKIPYPKSREKWRIFGFIASTNQLADNFTKHIKQSVDENSKDFNFLSSEIILERVLQRLNGKMPFIFENINFAKSNRNIALELDFAIASFKDAGLSFTGCGNTRSFLLRPARDKARNEIGSKTPANLQFVDLLGGLEGLNFDPAIGFKNIITGEILPGDSLIVTTKELWDFIDNEKLLENILQLPPKSAVEFLKNAVDENYYADENGQRSAGTKNKLLSCFLISSWRTREMYSQAVKDRDKRFSNLRAGNSRDSIFQLVNLTKETEKILTSSIKDVTLKNIFGSLYRSPFSEKSNFPSPTRGDNPKSPPYVRGGKGGLSWQKKYRFVFKLAAKIFLGLLAVLKGAVLFLIILARDLFLVFSKRNFKRPNLTGGPSLGAVIGLERHFSKLIYKFNSLPQKSKNIFILTVALSVLFSQSVFIVNARLSQKLKRERTQQAIQLIRNNLTAAEASLIYKDDETAFNLIQESLNLFETLPKNNKMEKEQRQALAKEIDTVRFAYQRATIILDPIIVAYFEKTSADKILKYDKKLIISDSDGLFFVEPEDRRIELLTTIIEQDDIFRLVGFWGSSEVLFFKNNIPYLLNLQTKLIRSVDWTVPDIDLDGSLLYFYANNLYILNTAQNKFLKIPGGSKGFGKSTDYLREEIDLRDALALTGDAAVYLFDKNGNIKKIKVGRQEKIKWSKLDPPLPRCSSEAAGTDPSSLKCSSPRMWTSEESLYLYILDPTGKRLIVYNKNGGLKKQYLSPQFDDLRDFAIDEKNEQIFLLNGNKIFGLVAEHLAD